MTDWFYLEHFGINILRLLCWASMGIFIGMFIQRNRVLERLKARLTKKEADG